MHKTVLTTFTATALAAIVAACGGGVGGGGGGGGGGSTPSTSTTISGSAVKGPVNNATVTVKNAANGAVLGTTTSSTGAYTL